MSLYVEAVKRGMPEGLTDDEQAHWWYVRDRDHLAVVVRQRNTIEKLRYENEKLRIRNEELIDFCRTIRICD